MWFDIQPSTSKRFNWLADSHPSADRWLYDSAAPCLKFVGGLPPWTFLAADHGILHVLLVLVRKGQKGWAIPSQIVGGSWRCVLSHQQWLPAHPKKPRGWGLDTDQAQVPTVLPRSARPAMTEWRWDRLAPSPERSIRIGQVIWWLAPSPEKHEGF